MFRLVAISIISLFLLAGLVRGQTNLKFGCDWGGFGGFSLSIVDQVLGALYSPDSAGTVDSVFVYVGGTVRDLRVCLYNFNDDDTTLVDSTEIINSAGSPTWLKLDFLLGGSVHPDSVYLIGGNADDVSGGMVMYFITNNLNCGCVNYIYETSFDFLSNDWPTTVDYFSGTNTWDVGAYVWYHTEAGAAPEGVTKYKQGPAEGSVAQSAKGSSPRQGP